MIFIDQLPTSAVLPVATTPVVPTQGGDAVAYAFTPDYPQPQPK
jgi:hypothetical protein